MTISGKSNQGEGSVGRSFAGPPRDATSWRQTTLIPIQLAQVRLDVGWHAHERAGMFSYEAWDPATKELLAMEVRPIRHYPTLPQFLAQAQATQRRILLDLFDPDPF